MLEGFVLLEPVAGAPSLSINEFGLAFNKTAVEKLSNPPYVKVMINRLSKQIAILPCSESEDGARRFLKEGRESKSGVRWNNFDLKSEISQLMNWNLQNEGKKIKGEYVKMEKALIFDLNKATALPTRNRGGSDE